MAFDHKLDTYCLWHCCSHSQCPPVLHNKYHLATRRPAGINSIHFSRPPRELNESRETSSSELRSESPASDPKSLIAEYSVRLASEDLCSCILGGTPITQRAAQNEQFSKLRKFFNVISENLVLGGHPLQPTTGALEITVQVRQCPQLSAAMQTSSYADKELNDYPR